MGWEERGGGGGGGTPFEFYKIENIVIKHSKNSNNKKTEGEE